MLLGPQHFQHESARIDSLVAWHALAANPLGWGVRRLQIDEGLFAAGTLRLTRLEAVMPDGTAVLHDTVDATVPDLQIDLGEFAEAAAASEVAVYLTLGRSRSLKGQGEAARFCGLSLLPVEDEVSDALPIDLPRMRHNLGLSAGPVPSSTMLHLKLLTVRKENEVFKLGDYVPASLLLLPDHRLRRRALALSVQMRSKAAFLAKQFGHPSSRLEDRVAALEQRERISALVQMLPLLEAVLRQPDLSPHGLYLALCMQLGPLTALRPGSLPLLPTAWEPADPAACIEPMLRSIEDSVAEVSQEWRSLPFRFDEGVFSIELAPESTGPRLVVGLRGRAEDELVAWMTSAAIGSQTVWTLLNDRRILGAARRPIDSAPELGLRGNIGYTLFSVEVTPEFVIAEQPLMIGNGSRSGTRHRPPEMVLFAKGL